MGCGGSLVDRGPDSHGVIQTCIKNGIKSVMGNHESSILAHYDRVARSGPQPRNQEKRETLAQLTEEDYNYIKDLPYLHVIDDLNLVIVHGGLFPKVPLYAQPTNVCRAQMIHPDFPGKSRWWGLISNEHYEGKTEEESRKEGYKRWYELYDHQQDVIYGHSTWSQPMIYQNPGYGKCIGIDTGSSFGGSLTACVYSNTDEFVFMSIKNKKVYYKSTTRSFWEE